MPSFGGEVKPSVPCCRFAARKTSLNLRGSRNLGKNYYRTSFSPTVPHFAARISPRRWGRRHLAAKVGTSKGGGKQWQTTPKNLPRMQCARAIPVTWLGSGPCQARPSRLNTNEWIDTAVRIHIMHMEPSFVTATFISSWFKIHTFKLPCYCHNLM